MQKHQVSYVLLCGFAAVIVLLLMLDDPAEQRALFAQAQATEQSQRAVMLFPELRNPTQIYGIEVLDIAAGKDILLMRGDQGLWYAPETGTGTAMIPAADIQQGMIEDAAFWINLMASEQWFDAVPANKTVFGFDPQPAYRIRFVAYDAESVSYAPVILEVGDANPDNVAYYVWPQTDQRIYLISREIVDPILRLVQEPIQIVPDPEALPAEDEATAPVP